MEANTLSDNISLILIENFHALASIFKPLASAMGSQGETKSETKKLIGSREAKGL